MLPKMKLANAWRSVFFLILQKSICLHLLQTQILWTNWQIVELPNHPFFIGAQFHPEYKSRPGKASPLFLGPDPFQTFTSICLLNQHNKLLHSFFFFFCAGLIAASCGELDTVMNPASVHQHLISNCPKSVFVNGTSKKAPNGMADVRYNNGYCNGLHTR